MPSAATHGLDPLARQSQLDAAAMDYSVDMACNNRVDFTRHTNSRGGQVVRAHRRAGLCLFEGF